MVLTVEIEGATMLQKIIQGIDNFIFDTFPAIQKIANVIEYFTNVSYYTVAQFTVIIGTAFSGSMAYQRVLAGEPDGWRVLGLLGLLVILFLAQAQIHMSFTHNRSQFRNPLRQSTIYAVLRLIYVSLCLWYVLMVYLEVREWWRFFGFASVTVGFYFLACDGLPPGDRFLDRFRKRVTA